MVTLSIIFIIVGALAVFAGIASIGGLMVSIFGDVSATLEVSFVFFGAIILIAGVMLLLSAKNDRTRQAVKKTINAKEFTLIIVLAVFVYVFWAINNNYLSAGNIMSIFNSGSLMGTLAVGLGCLLISGKIDLSAGSTGMMAGIIIAILLREGMPWVPALVVTLVFGAVTGGLNAFFVNGMGFAPFISTLAVSTIYGGLSLVITTAAKIPINNKSFLALGSTQIGVFPLPFIIMAILLAIYGVVLAVMGFGRRAYMTGGNANATRLAGINPKKITTILFVNNGVIASLAGSIFASRMGMGSPSGVTGSDLDAITAIVLGGVAFTGGSGNMFGVFIGVLVISGFQNGLVVSGLNAYYRVVATGLLLVAALILDYYRENAKKKALSTPHRESLTAIK